MATYDPKLLGDLAARLQNGTKGLVLVFTLMGAMIGAVSGSYVYLATRGSSKLEVALGTILLAAFGWIVGRERVFAMRVRAQEILCRMQVEQNTRHPQRAAAAGD